MALCTHLRVGASGTTDEATDDDLLFSNPDGADNIWWGGSEATFGPTNQKPVSLGAGVQPVFGDYDGDGKDDLFVYLKGSAGDTVWWGTTQADFATTPVGMPAGATASSTYRYDSSGLRSGKAVTTSPSGEAATTATTSSWDVSGGLPLLLRDKTGPDSTYLLYGPGGQPFEQVNPGGDVLWLHRDQLGSVRLATDTTGTATATRSWDAYGNPVTTTGSAQPLLGYAGQYTDTETGYQYLRARYYDPNTTQFLTLDPLVTKTGEPYGYAGTNPANASDPTGAWPLPQISVGDMAGAAWDATAGKAVHAVSATATVARAHPRSFLTGSTAAGYLWGEATGTCTVRDALVECVGAQTQDSGKAVTVGSVVLNPESSSMGAALWRHESGHPAQWDAAGPAFPLLYWASYGYYGECNNFEVGLSRKGTGYDGCSGKGRGGLRGPLEVLGAVAGIQCAY